MARISDMHKKWMKEPKYRKAYEALEEEFVLDLRYHRSCSPASVSFRTAETRSINERHQSRKPLVTG